ncbi:MAG: pyridoxamine 5-phosphate oxidase-related FMN-binding protein [Firmicutes bacterium]|nr:pyridoxamine 5-phosphate oxidase-related FMN-binding protein [Bacillota bacterium]
MLNEKLIAILSHPVDGAVSIVTNGVDGPHLVNTWNSYIEVTPDDKLLIPAYGFLRTEKNITANTEVTLSIANREVEGYRAKGTGVIVEGSARFIKAGEDFDRMKKKFDWARAVMEVRVTDARQTL